MTPVRGKKYSVIWNGLEIPDKNLYHVEDAAVIYCADCREILPDLPKVDLVLTDPPYNAKKDYGVYNDNQTEKEYSEFMIDVACLALEKAGNQFWIAPRYKLEFFQGLLPNNHLIVIRRGAAGPFRGGWSDQFEIALSVGKPSECIPDLWSDIRLKGEGYFFREETYGHPGYTPYPIMARAARILSDHTLIDPFLGSGTTAVAAKQLGRKCIGIEISEKYCEIARKRLAQGVMNLDTPQENKVVKQFSFGDTSYESHA